MKHKGIDQTLREKIDLYVDGELNEQEVDELWADLIKNDHALGYLKNAVEIKDLSEAEETTISEDSAGNLSPDPTGKMSHWLLAAALVLMAGALVLPRLNMNGNQSLSVQPAETIELNYYRSAGSAEEEGQLPAEVINLVNRGDHEEAIRMIDNGLERSQSSAGKANLQIHAGSVLYNAGKYEQALHRFDHVLKFPETTPQIREKAYWYMGNTYLQLGEPKAAKLAFQNTIEQDGAYTRMARAYLSKL